MTNSTRPRSVCKHCGSVCLLYRSRSHSFLCQLCGKTTIKGEKGSTKTLVHTPKGAMSTLTQKFPDGYLYDKKPAQKKVTA